LEETEIVVGKEKKTSGEGAYVSHSEEGLGEREKKETKIGWRATALIFSSFTRGIVLV